MSKRESSNPWRDEETLRHLYWDQEMSMESIADYLECGTTTVRTWMHKHDIEIRSMAESYERLDDNPNDVTLRTSSQGYEEWYRREGTLAVHRLLAVSEDGFDAVCGMDVHHINEIPWDNRPENLALMDPVEHSNHHRMKIKGMDRVRIAELYEHGDISYRRLHEVLDYDHVNWHTLMDIHKEFYGGATA